MNLTPHVVIEVSATDRKTLDRRLDDAEFLVRQEALRHKRCGVLVTRHGGNRFTVALNDSVPFGQTREHTIW